jgi:type I restriction enzyme S subunit
LVAGLGDEAHAVGRACCYPAELPPAINKADCFRLRCDASQALNPYVMLFLNTSRARHQVRRYEQGVTRLRMNLGNLRRIQIPLPSLQEQRMVIERVAAGTADIEAAVAQHAKAVATKQGLGADLLSGRVAVDGC